MAARVLRASPVAVGVTVVVVAVSIVGFLVTRHSTTQQEKALLQDDTEQAAALASSILSGVGSSLDSLATAVTFSRGSPSAFSTQAKPFAQGGLTVLLASAVDGHYVVTAAAGPGFAPGDVLRGSVGDTVARADATLTPSPVVRSGRTSTAGFAVGPPLVPAGDAIYLQFSLHPFTATPVTEGRPFANLRVALYGSKSPAMDNLLIATTRQLPLAGPVARAPVPLGTGEWTLVAEARSPLTGTFATHAPTIILFLGIFVGLLVGITVEILVRRQRYAAHLVAERTGDLERSLDDLHAAQRALVRNERLSALGEMASVVGHELRNPLTAVTNALFLVRRTVGDPTPPELEEHLSMAERETEKAATLAEDLTAFVRPREPALTEVALDEVVEEVVQSTPPPPHVDLRVDVVPRTVVADRNQMAEVITNLVANAYQAVPDGGSVLVELRADGDGAALVVEDDGTGIDAAVAERLFEPFFTTKANGTGLGLAIVRRLVEAHGGTITLANAVPRGARVQVHLPDWRMDGHGGVPDGDGTAPGGDGPGPDGPGPDGDGTGR
jgi:signal transduction histidine kinase